METARKHQGQRGKGGADAAEGLGHPGHPQQSRRKIKKERVKTETSMPRLPCSLSPSCSQCIY